jgi:hypothetical protein
MAKADGVTRLRIDLDAIKDRGNLGVRRAALFMGLGLHAAHREDFTDYELNKLPVKDEQYGIPVDIVPSNAPPKVVAKFKVEFADWITACGLRELLEHYALAADQVNTIGALVLFSQKKITALEGNRIQQKFIKIPGLGKKLERLAHDYSIGPKHPEHIASLYRLRNCLAHGGGIVSPLYTNSGDQLVCKWLAMEVFAQDASGKEFVGRQMYGKYFPDGGEILGRTVDREKRFRAGEKVKLTQQDLWEICDFFARVCVPTLLDSTLAYCEKNGVKITRVPEQKGQNLQEKWDKRREREQVKAEQEGEPRGFGVWDSLSGLPRAAWALLAGAMAFSFITGFVLG